MFFNAGCAVVSDLAGADETEVEGGHVKKYASLLILSKLSLVSILTYCQKIGFFVKISTWKALDGISHYHQPEGAHPQARPIPFPYEKVEVMTGGRGWVWHDGDWREVIPGDIIWNKSGDRTIGRSDFSNPYRCLAVTLVAKHRGNREVPRFSHWPDIEEVRAFTRECVRLFYDDEFDRQALYEHVVGHLLFRVRLHVHDTGRKELPLQLRAVLQKIESDYASPCRLEELAAIAGWSVAHLHEVFRERLQMTPHRMLIRLRLRAARERLASTNQPVKQIAVECGFSDSASFAHAFKAGTGLTPGDYRERSLRPVQG